MDKIREALEEIALQCEDPYGTPDEDRELFRSVALRARALISILPSCEGWRGLEVYTSADFTGHYPVGASAVVVAHSEDEARELLGAALKEHGLKFNGTLRRINITTPRAFVLTDGDY